MAKFVLFNKPHGVLSQFSPESGHRALIEFGFPPNVYPAGRLDLDSEGLLILTDDGPWIKKYLDPKFGHPRTYWAQVEGDIDESALSRLQRPLDLGDFTTLACRARKIVEPEALWQRHPPIRQRAAIPTSWVELVLTEGKNRQVRRMTAKVGFPTLRLIRSQILSLSLSSVWTPGQWRTIDASEVRL